MHATVAAVIVWILSVLSGMVIAGVLLLVSIERAWLREGQ